MASPEGISSQHSEVTPELSAQLFRLEQTYGAYRDMRQAEALLPQVNPQDHSFARGSHAIGRLSIGEAQAALGLDPSESFTEVITASTVRETQVNAIGVIPMVARAQASMGDFEQALGTARRPVLMDGKPTPIPRAFVVVAREALNQEQDVTAKAIMDEAVVATVQRTTKDIFSYPDVAVMYHKVGGDAKVFIDSAVESLNNEQERNSSYSYKLLAEAYARIGQFEAALSLVPKIKNSPHAQDYKNEVISLTASKQAEAGLFNEALQTADSAKSPFISADARIAIAKQAAIRRENPEGRIAEAVSYVDAYEGSTELFKETNCAQMLANIAEGQATAGIDPEPLFQKALVKASAARNTSRKVDAFIEIGRAQSATGRDVHKTFILALDAADEMVANPPEGDVSMYKDIERIVMLEDIADAVLDYSHEGMLELVFERMDKDGFDNTDTKIRLLTKRAKIRAQQGLTQQQLHKLTPDDKGDLIRAGGQTIKHALSYIELGVDTEAQTQAPSESNLAALREQFAATDRLAQRIQELRAERMDPRATNGSA